MTANEIVFENPVGPVTAEFVENAPPGIKNFVANTESGGVNASIIDLRKKLKEEGVTALDFTRDADLSYGEYATDVIASLISKKDIDIPQRWMQNEEALRAILRMSTERSLAEIHCVQIDGRHIGRDDQLTRNYKLRETRLLNFANKLAQVKNPGISEGATLPASLK